MKFENQHMMIIGLGRSGLAAARYLSYHGAKISAADQQPSAAALTQLQHDLPQIKVYTGSLAQQWLHDVDTLVVSPGVPLSQPAIAAFRRHGGEVLGDIEILARVLTDKPGKQVAISGSNGKSTVTSLVGHVCQTAGWDTVVAGNIGLPVLEVLLEREQTQCWPAVWVLELSSFQLESTSSLQADVATVLNISEDHLDRYPDLLHYAHVKTAIFNGQGIQVLNREDPLVRAMLRAGRQVKWFALATEAEYTVTQAGEDKLFSIYGESLLKASQLRLKGLHNVSNALAAWALCDSIHVPQSAIIEGLQTFNSLKHRSEWIGSLKGIDFINDSKATNVGATQMALQGLQQTIILIAGGDGKGQDFSPLRTACMHSVRAVMLLGRDAAAIEAVLKDIGLPIYHCETLEAATQQAFALARPNDAVLLSPACSSLDMFRDYAHRGEVFTTAFRQLSQEWGTSC